MVSAARPRWVRHSTWPSQTGANGAGKMRRPYPSGELSERTTRVRNESREFEVNPERKVKVFRESNRREMPKEEARKWEREEEEEEARKMDFVLGKRKMM